ncbi:uncharacterized protein LOC131353901 [Hemibagrus wyckioides]|uniref:uncharacterized protein LOC131353901 n=1 Tax=Hemibagrus wyckioides TaxID=337641 RepID=UPI00266D7165|nr:uncharacterized protein LOC131353901 [Hemibagrus wyckioides]
MIFSHRSRCELYIDKPLLIIPTLEYGCDLSGDNDLVEITQHQGGSVLLPCSCSDLNTKPQTFTWRTYRTGPSTDVLNDEHYRGRLQLFNNISPGNLSLFISDLREEDGADYRCSTEKEYRDMKINVKVGRRETSTHSGKTDRRPPSEQPPSKTTNSPPSSSSTTLEQDKQQTHSRLPLGCELVKKAEVEDMTVFTGESVVLPCVCTDLQNKPKSLKWEFSIPTESNSNHYQEIYPEQTGHHRNRVKLVSKNSPGNLSLLLSDLTEEDQGNYRCSVQAERKDFRLNVKVGRRETSTHSTEDLHQNSLQVKQQTLHLHHPQQHWIKINNKLYIIFLL